eukprot:gene45266-61325_t
MDEQRREIDNGAIFVRDNVIEQVGATADLPQQADEVIDASGQLVMPGLVNTHHHMYQSLTRAVPAVQDAELFGWLRGLYPIWSGLTPEMVQVSTQLHLTTIGRRLYAIGNNPEAARFSGIDVDRIRFTLFVVSGLGMAALSDIIAGVLGVILWLRSCPVLHRCKDQSALLVN